ncbi:FtsB family cell division protein [Bacillus thermotolerans]|uniref:Cell division protein DivIC (FtsB), stabilizes FtsL against RasP cleavage n=1 Tax=Bacillus thermotolerans TaxID=1221996 RepID=A0A0F5HQG0_BACTR|nr:septum formation initiator family protein [Bacillus thermotolerans]KKB35280.1 Cell division protein DivIC (FtsB), stabilizes FtsL against RasP cleavage [Bacillus thermotolerans]KKB39412.1 Cell division protein DivIC (FtsB), stabilizes FtsL against RasP cleavage [Bacillus thermotolerans]
MSGLNKRKVTKLKNAFVFSRAKKDQFLARHKSKLFRRLAAFAIIALLVFAGLLSTLWSKNAYLEEQKLAKEQAEAELAELKEKQKRYEEELRKLEDDEYIAELARKKYFLSDEGEIIFNLPESEEGSEESKE